MPNQFPCAYFDGDRLPVEVTCGKVCLTKRDILEILPSPHSFFLPPLRSNVLICYTRARQAYERRRI